METANVDIQKTKSSLSTVKRKMKKAHKEMAAVAKETLKDAVSKSEFASVLHFDGKTLHELAKGKSFKYDRLAVLVSTEGESYLLGVPPLESSTGEKQFTAINDLVNEYEVKDKVVGLCFDTTSSNTGLDKGACYRFLRELDRDLLLLACRHHVTELRMGKFWESVTKLKTVGPDNPLFKKLKSTLESPGFVIDYTKLTKFPWKDVRGTVLESAAEESLKFCKAYLQVKDNLRADRQELAELVVIYLDGTTGEILKIRKPGAVHHARFLSKTNYCLKTVILMMQLAYLLGDYELMKQLKELAIFISCFYAPWYLLSHEAIRAPFLDVSAIHLMFRYEVFCILFNI